MHLKMYPSKTATNKLIPYIHHETLDDTTTLHCSYDSVSSIASENDFLCREYSIETDLVGKEQWNIYIFNPARICLQDTVSY